jgi:hypothetical protein
MYPQHNDNKKRKQTTTTRTKDLFRAKRKMHMYLPEYGPVGLYLSSYLWRISFL